MNNIDPQILYSLGYILIFGSVFTFVYNIVNKFVSKKTQLDYITLRILLPKKDSQ
ncbi:MAG: hypothetical protein U9Q15_03525 [Patescibacteria group bacterium]|nr:hypothetical protein [Patescibacteria group bacterium]